MQATQYFDARLVEVSAAAELVIEYQGNTHRLPDYSSNGSDERMMAREYFERAHGMWRDEYN